VQRRVRAEIWKDLKTALAEEFAREVSVFQVHDKLRKRTKRKNESYNEYCYKMMNIAARIKMDNKTLIEYIIRGVNDGASNKNYLYDAKTIRELKEKLKRYKNGYRQTDKQQTNKRQTDEQKML